MGSSASAATGLVGGGATSPLVTAATGGGNILNDQILKQLGVQNGLQGALGGLQEGWQDLLGPKGGAPEKANIQQGTSVEDVKNAQQGTQNSLQSQQALLQALQAQNGLGMQNTAGSNQLGLANQLQAANGIGAQQGAISGLQGTAGMYQNIANGNGPNPARSMLNQATGQNVANQAALMASQRGAGANIGLMARQAAQQGANAQQQAVGQGATMQANQQLNALSGLTNAQQAVGGLGSGLTNQQMGANQAYANQANQVAGQQIAGTQANTQANLANQQAMQNSLQGINNSNVSSQGNVNAANADLAKAHAGALQAMFGGAAQGAGAMMGAARGGMVHMAEGGPMTPISGPVSEFGQYINSNPVNNVQESEELMKNETKDKFKPVGSPLEKGSASMTAGLMKSTPATAGARGGLANGGGHVNAKADSQKAVKSGNSYENDRVPAMLSEGEIVLPRSVTQSKNPKAAAASFVSQVLAKRKVRK